MGGSLTRATKLVFLDEAGDNGNGSTVDTIRAVWDSVQKCPEKQVQTGFKIYKRLFSKHPEYRNLFSEDMSLVVIRLTMMVSTIVDGLDDLPELQKRIGVLGKRHAQYTVPEEAFSHFTEAILWGMKESLNEEFTPHVHSCFEKMFNWSSQVMMYGAGKQPRKEPVKPKKYHHADFPELQDFETFLSIPICLEYFHLYLTSNYCEESIMFYIDIMKFKKTEISINGMENSMKLLAQQLYDKYIHAEGPNTINIPAEVIEEIDQCLDCPHAGIYDSCVTEISNLLQEGRWDTFLVSDTCQALCACLSGDISVSTDDSSLELMAEVC